MKLLTLAIIVLTIILTACDNKDEEITSQLVIPNSDFENWEIENDFDKIVDWQSSNFSLYSIVTFNTVSKDSINNYEGK